ncbi:16S rRNA (guanine(966)-N(2))-methyltransferase RsmD [Bacillus shivajii]|uniref:16S rRNA (guanine(966)-N(2))-methyltransferase RsmD n=1 Tax=Bacillus shivajii TaxID=1983719 RepID=UPI001CFB3A47|nr:16S rRNA (guanine(966)-N(2))-methyltransferase RsmD [Bacillus shivajii]UCZ51848.1 16S rRNA (guanine(966)-N(2))-methyltransferase RsmD [Bacillus shivajii]
MRVISGTRKGITLKAVPGHSTRPTTDKVKESIFNMVGPYFDGGSILDLYGGSGAISIEAISRGMEHAVIVDRDKKAISTIYQNVKIGKVKELVEVFRTDAKRALKAIQKNERSFDLVFLDPPYADEKLHDEISFISEHGILKEGGQMVVEHGLGVDLEPQYGDMKQQKIEQYGDTTIRIYESVAKEEI